MWADEPFEVLSLYGQEVAEPSIPTIFVSAVHAWATLPDDLRERAGDLHALHTSAGVRRGDVTDVVVLTAERPPTTTKPLALTHPRTGATVLYACEQMTQELPGLPAEESEALLLELFDHMYAPEVRIEHLWRERDLVVWDNIAVQHARPNVDGDGPARTLRKVGHPMPRLAPEEVPIYGSAT
jgi:alpha-ketoglutarate-dependent taurine dioxygenase